MTNTKNFEFDLFQNRNGHIWAVREDLDTGRLAHFTGRPDGVFTRCTKKAFTRGSKNFALNWFEVKAETPAQAMKIADIW